MKKIIIELRTVQSKEVTGYSIYGDNQVNIELDEETYRKFERDAKRFGMDVCEALGHGLTTLIKNGLP